VRLTLCTLHSVLVLEVHPYLPQRDVVEHCKSKGILVEAYSPLGSTSSPMLKEDEIVKLAEKYDTTPASICLSWLVAQEIVALPKSVTPSRITDNISKTVKLSSEDVKSLDTFAERYV
jgi:glycerol 2-dehydrogenase (NADP+)